MTFQIITGDVRASLATLSAASVHCAITSPPYYGLRDYGTAGQIGLEQTPAAYVAQIVAACREVWRVLRDDGTLWLNLGDSYAAQRGGTSMPAQTVAGGVGGKGDEAAHRGMSNGYSNHRNAAAIGYKHKDLMGIPWRVAFALQDDGWYLRSDIIWHKPNPMPESVTDRPTKSHEYIFLLAKSPRYFYDAQAIAEPAVAGYNGSTFTSGKTAAAREHLAPIGQGERENQDGAAGRNKRDVWTISTKPFPEAHFATFPTKLVEPMILAGTSARGVCPACGAPWARVVEKGLTAHDGETESAYGTGTNANRLSRLRQAARQRGEEYSNQAKTTGWEPSCECNAGDPVPATVLDPFSGAGTVGVVATRYGRNYIGCELNPEYVAMSERRIHKTQPGLGGMFE